MLPVHFVRFFELRKVECVEISFSSFHTGCFGLMLTQAPIWGNKVRQAEELFHAPLSLDWGTSWLTPFVYLSSLSSALAENLGSTCFSRLEQLSHKTLVLYKTCDVLENCLFMLVLKRILGL